MSTANAYKCEHEPPVDPARREQLILEHLPLVHWIANRIHENLPASITIEDLVSTGVLGLIAAIDNFDPRYNVKLGTYAQHRVRGAILDSIRGLDGISGPNRQKAKKVGAAISALEQRLQRVPSEEEIAAELNVTIEEYQLLLVDLRAVKLAALEADDEDRSASLVHYLADDEEHEPGHILERAELERMLADGISKLPKRERLVLSLYYKDELTLREIASVMDLHLTRVAQLKAQGILRLKAYVSRYWPSRRGAHR